MIEQKKSGNTHVFNFGEESLNFYYKDKSGSGDIDIPYVDVPVKFSVRNEQNEWLRNAGLLWCLIGVLQIVFAISESRPVSGSIFWFVVGLVTLAFFYRSKLAYTVFQTQHGSIFVIRDGTKHDSIVDEIKKRKASLLLSKYGDIDSSNDPNMEIQKFRWLHEQGVLSQEDMALKISQIEFRLKAAVGQRPDSPATPIL